MSEKANKQQNYNPGLQRVDFDQLKWLIMQEDNWLDH